MAEVKQTSQIRTPAGGMNQDDSIVTPSKDMAGHNSFEAGDYRYALNARIGSSRDDNYGDLENLRGTEAITNYLGTSRQSWTNSPTNFPGSLAGWSVYNSGSQQPWSYGSILGVTGAVVDLSGKTQSQGLFQAQPINTGDTLILNYSIGRDAVVGDPSLIVGLYLVYYNNVGVEIASNYLDNLNTYGSGVQPVAGSLIKLATNNASGIGFKILANKAIPGTYHLTTASFSINRVYNQVVTTPPAGVNKVIGQYKDNEFQRIYKAVWNSNGDHTISYFDPYTSTTYEVLKWSGLNFQSNYFVKMAKLDNWLALTDRNNAPRLIDTDNIGNLFLTLGTSNFREFHISFHKWAPTVPPVPRVFYDNSNNNYEKLKNKIYQFSYRYIYYGNLKSRWSPISKGAITTKCGVYYNAGLPPGGAYVSKQITSIEVDLPGAIFDNPSASTTYNYFDHNDLKFRSAVQYIEVAFREGELELWKLWKTIKVDSNFNRYHYFDGNANYTPVAQDDFNQIFDTVPFSAGTVEAVDNRFVFGDCLDELPPMTDLSVTNVGIATNGDWNTSYPSDYGSLSSPARYDILRKNSLSDFNFKDRGLYKVGIQWLHKTGWRSAIYTTDNWVYNTDDTSISGSNNPLLGFNFTLNGTAPDWAVGYQIFRTNVLNFDYFMYGTVNKFTPLVDDISKILDQVNLPLDIRNRIRQHFENQSLIDANAVQDEISDELIQNINSDIDKNRKRVKKKTKLALATGILGHARGASIAPKLLPELRLTKAINLLANASRIYIDINNWYYGAKKATDVEYPLNKLFYNFQVGDRIRFAGSSVTATPTLLSQLKEFDVLIIEFTGKGFIIEKPADLLWIQGTTSVAGSWYFGIEVYTPKNATPEDHEFYETGEWYPVLHPGENNRTLAKYDFVYTNNAAVTDSNYGPFYFFNKVPFFYSDCYLTPKTVYRDSVTAGPGFSGVNLSMNPDPDKTFGYWEKSNGRAAGAYINIPISAFKKTMARFGGKIIEQSYVNLINNFQDQDQFIYPSEYGRIRALVNTSNAQVESAGSILFAIGERTSWSIYVNRTTLEDLSGETQVSVSNKVLGSFNSLLGNHGTLNPESVSVYRGNVYYWDAINGSWIRYGRDGLTPISDYKMRNWFKEIANLLINQYSSSELPKVISEFDPFNMELVTYIEHSSLPAKFRGYSSYKGATFSESDKRWKNIHNYQPEMFSSLNNQLYSFLAGVIYKHESLINAYSTFYGNKYDVYWEPVFNDENDYKKSWQALAEVSTDAWSVERILSEYRGAKAKQESRITLDKFSQREDNFYAEIPRDVNSIVNNPIIEGDRIRSKAIQVLMKLDPTIVRLSLLHYVYAICIDSPKNS